mmetsp:Transcript_16538/g.55606  ORF Transcript_16538/g.55606 Transcript_16538/m.55606 type:complete len:335 (-) Transcript_16538:216-1220(-)
MMMTRGCGTACTGQPAGAPESSILMHVHIELSILISPDCALSTPEVVQCVCMSAGHSGNRARLPLRAGLRARGRRHQRGHSGGGLLLTGSSAHGQRVDHLVLALDVEGLPPHVPARGARRGLHVCHEVVIGAHALGPPGAQLRVDAAGDDGEGQAPGKGKVQGVVHGGVAVHAHDDARVVHHPRRVLEGAHDVRAAPHVVRSVVVRLVRLVRAAVRRGPAVGATLALGVVAALPILWHEALGRPHHLLRQPRLLLPRLRALHKARAGQRVRRADVRTRREARHLKHGPNEGWPEALGALQGPVLLREGRVARVEARGEGLLELGERRRPRVHVG